MISSKEYSAQYYTNALDILCELCPENKLLKELSNAKPKESIKICRCGTAKRKKKERKIKIEVEIKCSEDRKVVGIDVKSKSVLITGDDGILWFYMSGRVEYRMQSEIRVKCVLRLRLELGQEFLNYSARHAKRILIFFDTLKFDDS